VFGDGKYGNANRIPIIYDFSTLSLIGMTAFSLLRKTLASETTVDRGYREMDRRERPAPG